MHSRCSGYGGHVWHLWAFSIYDGWSIHRRWGRRTTRAEIRYPIQRTITNIHPVHYIDQNDTKYTTPFLRQYVCSGQTAYLCSITRNTAYYEPLASTYSTVQMVSQHKASVATSCIRICLIHNLASSNQRLPKDSCRRPAARDTFGAAQCLIEATSRWHPCPYSALRDRMSLCFSAAVSEPFLHVVSLLYANSCEASVISAAQGLNAVSLHHLSSPAPAPITTSLLRSLLSGLVPQLTA